MSLALAFFTSHPAAFFILALAALVAFLFLAVQPMRVGDGARSTLTFCAAIAVLMYAWRWPIFISPNQLNADEGQMVANALKATTDFVPWRGFDGTTSGPLNSDVLVLPALFGAHIDFFSARFIGVMFVIGALCALYFAVRWAYDDDGIARLSIIPPAALLATVRDLDFVHYSSEHLPIFLTTVGLAAASYVMARRAHPAGRVAAAIIGGFSLGCAPFAKLQALPIAAAVFAYLVAAIACTRHERGARLAVETAGAIAGCFIPGAALLGAVLLTGEWNDFVMSYLRFAAGYVQGNTIGLGFFFGRVPAYTAFAAGALLVGSCCVAALLRHRPNMTTRAALAGASAIALLAAAIFAIYEAHREFPHYLLFSIIPIAWCAAALLQAAKPAIRSGRRERWLTAAFALVFTLPAAWIFFNTPDPFMKDLPSSAKWPQSPVAVALQQYAPRGSTVAIWGWVPQYYVETGTIMASRDAHTHHQIEDSALRPYFRDRFMSDLRAHPPRVIVDAVAPGSFGYTNPATQGIESFPALAAFVHQRYALANNVGGVRIFRDRRIGI
ncbi:MAG: hypothetical protein JWO66_2823 [Candidatus Eremiobacteraeota bacterium]|nr:hypothetical protein [Candidatus Eremiobacteraeota bacterium]